MASCPNKNHPDWIRLEEAVGKDNAYKAFIANDDTIPSGQALQEVIDSLSNSIKSVSDLNYSKGHVLYNLQEEHSDNKTRFNVHVLSHINTFLEDIDIGIESVDDILNEEGTPVENALAAADFMNGTVKIINDLNKRAKAWDSLPEEAAHWWYRLLKTNSPLKKALWESKKTKDKVNELLANQYGEAFINNEDFVPDVQVLDMLTEEAIGQLIADQIEEATKDEQEGTYNVFWKLFIEWINGIIEKFNKIIGDPYNIAAIKILTSDRSDLLTFAEYKQAHDDIYPEGAITDASIQNKQTLEEIVADLYIDNFIDEKVKKRSRFLKKTY
jgi:hypothetical protein